MAIIFPNIEVDTQSVLSRIESTGSSEGGPKTTHERGRILHVSVKSLDGA